MKIFMGHSRKGPAPPPPPPPLYPPSIPTAQISPILGGRIKDVRLGARV